MRILVIEDEKRMSELLRQGLDEEGHFATLAHDGREGLALAQASSFDAIVLDVMLPHLDGFSVAKRLRDDGNQTPILMLTARDGEASIVRGLNLGADDYLTKPFSFDVFLARLRAVSRRGPIPTPACIRVADLEIDTGTREVKRGKRHCFLSPREYSLLELLARSSPRVLTRDTILEVVWGFDGEVLPNTLEAFVHLLRGKIGDPKLIHTVRGIGYCLRAGDP